jgi:AcrR family transcriptional regulator
VFHEHGYEKSKVSDIVASANLAQGTFYLYFKSKKDCLNVLMDDLTDIFIQELRAETERMNEKSIYRIVRNIADAIERHKGILTIMHFEQANMDEKVGALYQMVNAESIRLIRDSLRRLHNDERLVEIKTALIDAVINQYLLGQVYIVNQSFIRDRTDLDEMLKIVINEVTIK